MNIYYYSVSSGHGYGCMHGCQYYHNTLYPYSWVTIRTSSQWRRSHVPMAFPIALHVVFPYSQPAKLHMFCNFGTPKSPEMFNILFNLNRCLDFRSSFLTHVYPIFFFAAALDVCILKRFLSLALVIYDVNIAFLGTHSLLDFIVVYLRVL